MDFHLLWKLDTFCVYWMSSHSLLLLMIALNCLISNKPLIFKKMYMNKSFLFSQKPIILNLLFFAHITIAISLVDHTLFCTAKLCERENATDCQLTGL